MRIIAPQIRFVSLLEGCDSCSSSGNNTPDRLPILQIRFDIQFTILLIPDLVSELLRQTDKRRLQPISVLNMGNFILQQKVLMQYLILLIFGSHKSLFIIRSFGKMEVLGSLIVLNIRQTFPVLAVGVAVNQLLCF